MDDDTKKVTENVCNLKHAQTDRDIQEIKNDIAKINGKLWSGLVLIIMQLLGLFVFFVKGCSF